MFDPDLNSDRGLLLRIAEGNEGAFTVFFRKLSPHVLLWAGSILHQEEGAKEILQEVFIRVWLNRAELPEILNLEAWVKKITLNQCFTMLKSNARRVARENALVVSGSESPDIVEKMSLKELQAEVEIAFNALPEQRKKIYYMSRVLGMSTEEIAQALDLTPGTVRNTLTQALAAIRSHLKATSKYVPLFLLFLK